MTPKISLKKMEEAKTRERLLTRTGITTEERAVWLLQRLTERMPFLEVESVWDEEYNVYLKAAIAFLKVLEEDAHQA